MKNTLANWSPKLYTFGDEVDVVSYNNPTKQIKERIVNADYGTIFIPSDFSDITDYVNIKKSLSRLAESGLIRRVMRGVYENPEYNDFLKQYITPSPHRVALAVARNFGWTIVPDGDTALNQLGLSTQVPSEWTYVSDGPYKEYNYGNTIIRFKHTANKDISKLSYKSALLVQAIKAIGKKDMSNVQIKRMRNVMSVDERSAIITEGKQMTAWVYKIVKEICNGDVIT